MFVLFLHLIIFLYLNYLICVSVNSASFVPGRQTDIQLQRMKLVDRPSIQES